MKYRIPCYMFDLNEKLRPAAFMDMAQELAAKGSEDAGFADKDIKEHNLVWILARMTVRFDRYPRRLDEVVLETWHRGLDGMLFLRDYRMLSQDGTPEVLSSSSWVIMDTQTRRIVRPAALEGIIPFEPQCDDPALEACPKLFLPKDTKPVKVTEHKVTYSDLDYNGHANNAKYTVWSMDCLPLDTVTKRSARRISINFNREALPEETVRMDLYEENDTFYVEGSVDGQRVFICKIDFE